MSVFAIDFGTTYARIATIDANGKAVVIPDRTEASDALASVVYFPRDEEPSVLVGADAKAMVETDGERVVSHIRYALSTYEEEGLVFDGRTYHAVDITAMILKRLVTNAEAQGHTVQDVVLTYPVYYTAPEKNKLLRAAQSIGLHVVGMITEPQAAILSCTADLWADKTILVCDLGGATLDLTMVKAQAASDTQIIAVDGDHRLGGEVWDAELYQYILNVCAEENGFFPEDLGEECHSYIRSQVEHIKKQLTTTECAKIRRIPLEDGIPATVTVTRAEFEEMSAHLVERALWYIQSVLERCDNIQPDVVLLAGGAAAMPMIRNALEECFRDRVQCADPQTAVVRGAAIYANLVMNRS